MYLNNLFSITKVSTVVLYITILLSGCSSQPPSNNTQPSELNTKLLKEMCERQPESPWCKSNKDNTPKNIKELSKNGQYQAIEIFNKAFKLFTYRTDKNRWKVKDKWIDYIDNINHNKPFYADCEDMALTWGSVAYQQFGVPAKHIRLVRGLSDRGARDSPNKLVDHAWTVIKLGQAWYAFDVYQNNPVYLQNIYHSPYDYIIMQEFEAKRW